MPEKLLSFTLVYRINIFVFILYSIFFLLCVEIIIVPGLEINYYLFYLIMTVRYFFYPVVLFPFLIGICFVIFYLIDYRPHESRQILKLFILSSLIVVFIIVITFLLFWMDSTLWIIFRAHGFD